MIVLPPFGVQPSIEKCATLSFSASSVLVEYPKVCNPWGQLGNGKLCGRLLYLFVSIAQSAPLSSPRTSTITNNRLTTNIRKSPSFSIMAGSSSNMGKGISGGAVQSAASCHAQEESLCPGLTITIMLDLDDCPWTSRIMNYQSCC